MMNKSLFCIVFILLSITLFPTISIREEFDGYWIVESKDIGELHYIDHYAKSQIIYYEVEGKKESYLDKLESLLVLINEGKLDLDNYNFLTLTGPVYQDLLKEYLLGWNEIAVSGNQNMKIREVILRNSIYQNYLNTLGLKAISVQCASYKELTKEDFQRLGIEYQSGVVIPEIVNFKIEKI